MKTMLIDVENDSIEEMADKMQGFEQVVFSVGSGGSTGADKTELFSDNSEDKISLRF